MQQTPDLISTREAMEILEYANPSSVARMVYEGKLIPAYRIGPGGAYAFHRADVIKAAEARKAGSAA